MLIVDDDQWMADVYTRQLIKDGYVVTRAANAIEGIRMLDDAPPDVVILDIFMPGANGFTLLHEMRSYADLSGIPVILCTNSVERIPRRDLREYGILRILDKATMMPGDIGTSIRGVLA